MSKVSIAALEKLLLKLIPILDQYSNEKLSEDRVAELFSNTANILLPKADKSQLWALFSCYDYLRNRIATPDLMRNLIYRIYSYLDDIKAGISPSLWDGTKTRAFMLVTSVAPAPELKGKRRLLVRMVCIYGKAAGLTFEKELSCNLLEYIMGKYLGVSFKKFNAPAEEITGCMFGCFVEESSASTVISEYCANSYMKEHNKKLAEARASFKKCKTPLLPCARCKKTRKECRLAVWK